MNEIFENLVAESGLSSIFAKTVIERAVRRSGMNPSTLQRSDLDRLLPELERALTSYLGESVAQARATAIKRALGR